MTRAALAIPLTAVACGFTAAAAQEASLAPLFESDTALELTIELPLRQLYRDGVDDRPEYDSIVRYRAADGTEVELEAEIRVRGRSRLEYFCDFPPLRVDFDRDDVGGTVFAGQNHLKLVTLCSRSDSYRDYLAQEHAIYKALNALTERSFRVRWAAIEYVDTDTRRGSAFVEPAFFIEEDWAVAKRTGANILEVRTLDVADLDVRMAALLGLFQFMIGNTDWSAIRPPPDDSCCHNGKPIGTGYENVIVLPYDFDHAGLVDADYAAPSSRLPIRTVRQRLYRGYCTLNAELDWAVARFNASRAEIEAAFAAAPVHERTRERTLEYVAEFYEIVNDAERRREEIVEDCGAVGGD